VLPLGRLPPIMGLYLLSLGINYVPMLIHAVAIAKSDSARSEMGDELEDKRGAMAKYRRPLTSRSASGKDTAASR